MATPTAWGRVAIKELVVFNSKLDTAGRQKMEGYLAWKWGLVAALPADHPYKDVPPKIPPRGIMILVQ
jgi:hypothetical protein